MDKGLRNFSKSERWREQKRMRRFYSVWLKYHPNKTPSSMTNKDWDEFNNYYRAQIKADRKLARQPGRAGYEGKRRMKYKTIGMDVGPSRHRDYSRSRQNDRTKGDAFGVPQPVAAAGGAGPTPPSGPNGGGNGNGGKKPPHKNNPHKNKNNKKPKKNKTKRKNPYADAAAARKRKKYAEIYKDPDKGLSPKDKVLKTTVKDFKRGTKTYRQTLKHNNGRRYEVDEHGNLHQHSGTNVKPGASQNMEAKMAKGLYGARDRMQNNNDADSRNTWLMGLVQMMGDSNRDAANNRLFQALDLTNITHHILHHRRYKRIVNYQNILDHDRRAIKRDAGIKAGIIKPNKRAKMKDKVLHIHPHAKQNNTGLHKSKDMDPDLKERLLAIENRREGKTGSISHDSQPKLGPNPDPDIIKGGSGKDDDSGLGL